MKEGVVVEEMVRKEVIYYLPPACPAMLISLCRSMLPRKTLLGINSYSEDQTRTSIAAIYMYMKICFCLPRHAFSRRPTVEQGIAFHEVGFG